MSHLAFVLIIILGTHGVVDGRPVGDQTEVQTQEFTSMKTCTDARVMIERNMRNSLVKAECVPR